MRLEAVFTRQLNWTKAYREYCHTLAKKPESVESSYAAYSVSRHILSDLAQAKTRYEASEILFALVLALESLADLEAPERLNAMLDYIKFILDEACEMSPTVGMRLVVLDGNYALVPYGAGVLDESLVDANLVWLEAYPDAAKAFLDALQTYGEGDRSRYRNVLDNLRFALEQVLKGVLGNSKSLENQKSVLLPWLKQKGVHEQTVNLFQAVLFGPYSHFQNNAVKHAAEYSEKEVEFYIYQTGTLLRLLLTLAEAA